MERKMRMVGLIAMGIVATGVFSVVVMLLWNWILPPVFGITAINFWQAAGILVLSKILFGGFGFGRHHVAGHQREHHNRLRERWINMSDEERNKFLKQRRHFGFGRDYFDNLETEKKE